VDLEKEGRSDPTKCEHVRQMMQGGREEHTEGKLGREKVGLENPPKKKSSVRK